MTGCWAVHEPSTSKPVSVAKNILMRPTFQLSAVVWSRNKKSTATPINGRVHNGVTLRNWAPPAKKYGSRRHLQRPARVHPHTHLIRPSLSYDLPSWPVQIQEIHVVGSETERRKHETTHYARRANGVVINATDVTFGFGHNCGRPANDSPTNAHSSVAALQRLNSHRKTHFRSRAI